MRTHWTRSAVALLATFSTVNLTTLRAQEHNTMDQDYEREELGVNPYTAPSIERIFQQLDELKPLPVDQRRRNYSQSPRGSREQVARFRRINCGRFPPRCVRKERIASKTSAVSC